MRVGIAISQTLGDNLKRTVTGGWGGLIVFGLIAATVVLLALLPPLRNGHAADPPSRIRLSDDSLRELATLQRLRELLSDIELHFQADELRFSFVQQMANSDHQWTPAGLRALRCEGCANIAVARRVETELRSEFDDRLPRDLKVLYVLLAPDGSRVALTSDEVRQQEYRQAQQSAPD